MLEYSFSIKNINNLENAECKEGFEEFGLKNVNFSKEDGVLLEIF